MRAAVAALLALSALAATPASAREGCTAFRATCESVCTHERVVRYYAGSFARCTASCVPRWNQCLRTGIWADLEYRYSGWYERATGF